MKKFYSLIRNFKIPNKNEIRAAVNSFTKREYFTFLILFGVLLLSTIVILNKVNRAFLDEVPAPGGSISEGIVGTPRFVNPILAISDADRDMTALIYSGLTRKMPGGELAPDLAEKYEISKDGLTYTFTLRPNIYFHDKTRVTAEDVIFTVSMAKDSILKSPKRVNWEGVTAKKIDDQTIQFTLKQPFASFLDNTTLGILPSHIWKDVPAEEFSFSDFNQRAIGSGPFVVSSISKKSSGVADYYELKPFSRYVLGKPYIKKLTIKFYANEKDEIRAIEAGTIDQAGSVSPSIAEFLKDDGFTIRTTTLPRIFALFFNQNEAPLFTDKAVVRAISAAVDKDYIIREVLHGYGQAIDSPLPPQLVEAERLTSESAKKFAGSINEAKKILEDAGWKMNESGLMEKTKTVKGKKEKTELSFSISTGDDPELKKTAEILKETLEKIGCRVELKIYELGSLNQDVIRPRKYDSLLFGQVITHESDLFAFWHSSQRNDPGLNIGMYTNSKVDKILESALSTFDKKGRLQKYTEFENEIKKDLPAIFLYSPDFVYVVDRSLQGLDLNKMELPTDRFAGIHGWYKETDKIWKIFNKNN